MPEHVIMLWVSAVACGNEDLDFLIEYLESKERDCHVNTGVHGMLNKSNEFEFAWEIDGEDLHRQDEKTAEPTKNKVSLHRITREDPPVYHAGVDVIDGFCYSAHRKLTEADLDKICEEYLKKEKARSDEDAADLVGGDIEEFDYNGNDKPKKFLLEWLRDASKLKKLELPWNEIKVIEKLTHLKELEYLDLGFNKI